jgi:hypothetical protein
MIFFLSRSSIKRQFPSNGFEKQHSIVANSLMSDAIEGEHVPILEKHPQLLLMVIFHVPPVSCKLSPYILITNPN